MFSDYKAPSQEDRTKEHIAKLAILEAMVDLKDAYLQPIGQDTTKSRYQQNEEKSKRIEEKYNKALAIIKKNRDMCDYPCNYFNEMFKAINILNNQVEEFLPRANARAIINYNKGIKYFCRQHNLILEQSWLWPNP